MGLRAEQEAVIASLLWNGETGEIIPRIPFTSDERNEYGAYVRQAVEKIRTRGKSPISVYTVIKTISEDHPNVLDDTYLDEDDFGAWMNGVLYAHQVEVTNG